MGTKSMGYHLIKNVVGEEYMEVICDLSSKLERNYFHIPTKVDSTQGICKKLLEKIPYKLVQKLVFELGGQRFYITKYHHKIDDADMRKRMAECLTRAGFSLREISQEMGKSEVTILDRYMDCDHGSSAVVSNEVQLGLF